MTQSEEDILTALIMQHGKGYYVNNDYNLRAEVHCSETAARVAAKRIMACGFSMARLPVDEMQDADIDELRVAVEQLRGWSGLPPELRRM